MVMLLCCQVGFVAIFVQRVHRRLLSVGYLQFNRNTSLVRHMPIILASFGRVSGWPGVDVLPGVYCVVYCVVCMRVFRPLRAATVAALVAGAFPPSPLPPVPRPPIPQ
jgi:hypothetical protein